MPVTQMLRAVTYMCPDHPVEFYQAVLELLENETGCQTSLQYEWRTEGPMEDRPCPFENNFVDIAFMSSTAYIKLTDARNPYIKLLPVSPIFEHPKNFDLSPSTFVDIIVHVDKLKHNVSEIIDLRGCRWAYSREDSLANRTLLDTLHKLGENASFFGSNVKSASHLDSINMVLGKKVEAAAVDSSTLLSYKKTLQDGAKDVHVLNSIGPLSPFPIVISNRISADLMKRMVQVLLDIDCKKHPFSKWGLVKFSPNSDGAYDLERSELMETGKSRTPFVRYY